MPGEAGKKEGGGGGGGVDGAATCSSRCHSWRSLGPAAFTPRDSFRTTDAVTTHLELPDPQQ